MSLTKSDEFPKADKGLKPMSNTRYVIQWNTPTTVIMNNAIL